jgi:hypothetical protein
VRLGSRAHQVRSLGTHSLGPGDGGRETGRDETMERAGPPRGAPGGHLRHARPGRWMECATRIAVGVAMISSLNLIRRLLHAPRPLPWQVSCRDLRGAPHLWPGALGSGHPHPGLPTEPAPPANDGSLHRGLLLLICPPPRPPSRTGTCTCINACMQSRTRTVFAHRIQVGRARLCLQQPAMID